MREYGIISPKFWIGKTGRKLRAHPYAQRVALYLMTAPNADMTGVYYCPLSSILNDVGSPSNVPLKPLESPFEAPCEGYKNPFEGVKAAISVLEELGFCVYDAENEYVFVVEMARWQVADTLKATDNRVKGIKKYVESMPEALRQRFINRYNDAFSLGYTVRPLEAPSKLLRSQEQEQEQEQEKALGGASALPVEAASETVKPKKPTASIPKPEGVPQEDWDAYKKLRKEKRMPLTQRALEKLQREADKAGKTLAEVIVICLENSWASFGADWKINGQAAAVEEFSDDRYADAMNPDGSLNWG